MYVVIITDGRKQKNFAKLLSISEFLLYEKNIRQVLVKSQALSLCLG